MIMRAGAIVEILTRLEMPMRAMSAWSPDTVNPRRMKIVGPVAPPDIVEDETPQWHRCKGQQHLFQRRVIEVVQEMVSNSIISVPDYGEICGIRADDP